MLFLIGLPGVGKTFWGNKIANEYNLIHVDLDNEIEKHTGVSIQQIFEKDGETVFRKIEAEVLRLLIAGSTTKLIISCGGGTPIYHDNIHFMQSAGCVIYLKASVQYIANRLDNKSLSNRPLLNGQQSLPDILQRLLESRKNIYETAQYCIDTETVTVGNFAEIVSECTGQH